MIRMLIALLGGMLIGLERERAQISGKSKRGGSIPGMRSFGLLSMYGALVFYTITLPGGSATVMAIAFTGVVGLVILYAYTRLVKLGVQGVTTYIVMMLSFVAGGLAGYGLILESAGVSVLTTLTLALKHPAEKAASAIKYNELLAMIEVAALALIIGPIVRSFSNASGLSIIFKSYLFFIIILMLSLATYMAARVWGTRGIIYSTILGALVNSEAAVTSLLEKARPLPDTIRTRLVGVLVPLIIVVAQIKLALFGILGIIIFTGTINYIVFLILLISLIYLSTLGYIFYLRLKPLEKAGSGELFEFEIASPISWSAAIKGALAYTVMALAFIAIGRESLPYQSSVPVLLAFLGGLFSATAVILSLGASIASLPTCSIGASIIAVLAAVSLNKTLYAQAANADSRDKNIVYKWSVVLSMAPLLLLVVMLPSC